MEFKEQLLLVRKEDRETIELFFKKKKNLSTLKNTGTTLLHLAAKYGTTRLIKICLRNGFEINALDSLGRTSLTLALQRQHIPIMCTLLRAGADMFLRNHENKSPLHELFEGRFLDYNIYDVYFKELEKKCFRIEEMAQVMLDHGCYLFQAVFSRDFQIIKYMMNPGLHIHSVHPWLASPALHFAVLFDDVKIVKLLIDHGINVQALDRSDMSPIAYTYRYNTGHTAEKMEILEALLSAGVPPMSYVPRRVFQISWILWYGNLEAIRVLLRWNVDFSARDGGKRNMLHYLAKNMNPGIVEELKRLVAVTDIGINEIDFVGTMPLHVAIEHHNVEMVRFLLEQGALTNYVSNFSRHPPLSWTNISNDDYNFKHESLQNVQLLLHHGADPQFIHIDNDGSNTTIFDMSENRFFNQLKCVIAQLAVLEELGTPINKIIYDKIESNRKYKKYFKRCKRVLKKCIHESVTVLELLTANEKQVAKYLSNKRLILKLKRISYKQQVKSSFSYYLNSIKMRFSKGFKYRMLKKEATEVIGNVFKSFSLKNDLIVAETLKHFNLNDLEQLYTLNKKV